MSKKATPDKPKPVQLHARLYARQDDDLIAWLRSLDGLPYSHKSQRIRAALRYGIGATDDLYQMIRAAVQDALEQRG